LNALQLPFRIRSTSVVVLACLCVSHASAQLVLRHGEPSPVGDVVSVSPQGVAVGSQAVAPVLVPWARVLKAEGYVGDYAELADLAWRAPLRVARDDTLTAEPMFERLLALLGEDTGPTTTAAWFGLMRCQQARGANDLAIMSWSRWVDAKADAGSLAIYRARSTGRNRARIDQITQPAGPLLVELAPVWPRSAEPTVLATSEQGSITTRGGLLLAWYRSAARIAAGLTPEFPETSSDAASNDPSVQFVRECVLAQSNDRPRSRDAREKLVRRLESETSDWTQAWAHAAIGRSLIREQDRAQRELGVVHLLHVPAQWGVVTPGLARITLADAARTLESLGDSRGREAVEAELRRVQLASNPSEESFP